MIEMNELTIITSAQSVLSRSKYIIMIEVRVNPGSKSL